MDVPPSSGSETYEAGLNSYAERDFQSGRVKKLRTPIQFTEVAQKIPNDESSNFYLM